MALLVFYLGIIFQICCESEPNSVRKLKGQWTTYRSCFDGSKARRRSFTDCECVVGVLQNSVRLSKSEWLLNESAAGGRSFGRAHRLLQSIEHASRNLPGSQEARRMMRFDIQALRILYGLPVVVTFPPDERHKLLMI